MLTLMVLTVAAAPPSDPPDLTDRIQARLRHRLEAMSPEELAAGGERIYASSTLPQFYYARLFEPAWSGERGPLPRARELLAALRAADREGLVPEHYHLAAIEQTLADAARRRAASGEWDARTLADLDLLLTDGFMIYGSHLLSGRINPETIDPEWRASRRGNDFAVVLEEALAAGNVTGALERMKPPQAGYAHLKRALERYRRLAAQGGWPTVDSGPILRRGDTDPRVERLRTRLILAGDLRDSEPESAGLFDADVEAAVRRFQQRHGLAITGQVGPATLSHLNVPVERRLEQVLLNLERWRWLPQDLGRRHILVNIAAFTLDVFEEDSVVLHMRVMVGRIFRRTPVFSGRMTYMVLSPFWHVPHNLAVADQLPLIQRDAGYFERVGMRVFQGWGAETREIDPATVDWSQLSARNFPYRLRQDPGPANALGRVKFMFPNRHAVYLHDTPARELFDRPDRAFSSGCIRIELPLELAEYLVAGDARWTRQRLAAGMRAASETDVQLRRPIDVHLLYWTAWADAEGAIHFRNDIYERDLRVARAMAAPPPTS